ncbi:MAG: glycosyltransferase, partial [Burkholderiaceae bacterium]
PITAAIHDTPAARHRLAEMLAGEQGRFDAIVLDQLGSGWALAKIKRWISLSRRANPDFKAPALIYLAHNHERVVWSDMARDASGSWPRRLAVRSNASKVARLEAQLLRDVDQVICITDEDANALVADGLCRRPLVITPGYAAEPAPPRSITQATGRRVVMVGSFKWAIKEENLRQFVALADPAFARHNIRFDVIGKVPEPLRRSLQPKLRATKLHGFVQNTEPLFSNARMAVVPEQIGGGFKLKVLDYIFGRMPVATIEAAAAGLPESVKDHLLKASDLRHLVDTIVANIDHYDRLNSMQAGALEQAQGAFQWEHRGELVREAIDLAVLGATRAQTIEGPAGDPLRQSG